jgi:RNA recognition motif-containing protein
VERQKGHAFSGEEKNSGMKTIYVGNLPFSASEDELRKLFSRYGEVHSVNLIMDRETGRPRGFGFVEMESEGAQAAIAALNGTQLGGRALRINEARERERKPRPPQSRY